MGATDYLPKPFNAAVLHARVGASLAGKRLRDLELEYLEQVGRVTDAAAALEEDRFDAAVLEPVAVRDDALGVLARSFARMAGQVRRARGSAAHARSPSCASRSTRPSRRSAWPRSPAPTTSRSCAAARAELRRAWWTSDRATDT